MTQLGSVQCPGTAHGGLFICRRHDNERMFEILFVKVACRFDNQGKEPLHIACSQSIETLVFLLQLERV